MRSTHPESTATARPRRAPSSPLDRAAALTTATAAAAGLATVAGLGGRWWPGLDLAAHFRLHGLLALTPGLALALARRRPYLAVALGVPWLVSAASVARCFMPPTAVRTAPQPPADADAGADGDPDAHGAGDAVGDADADADVLRIATFNVWGVNPTPHRIAPYLDACGADIAVVIELRSPLAALLADPTAWSFAPVATAPRDDFYGVGIYVRRDAAARGIVVSDGRAEVLLADDPKQRPSVTATVAWAGRQATLIGVHPPPPKGARMTIERDRALRAAGARLAADGRPGILCGDINAAPWSTARRAVGRAAPLHDAAQGHGYVGTWPAALPSWFGIPIDVCLIDPSLAAVAYAVGPLLGSDHRPVVATLVWR